MISKECSSCHKPVAQNELIKVDGTGYCQDCFTQAFPDKDSVKGKMLERETDPTICSRCTKDFGDQQLNKISVYPICDECDQIMATRTFPVWVKAFFAGTVAVVIFAFFWNWRYYQAYDAIKEANAAFGNSDFSKAYQWMNLASEKVPEVNDVKAISEYFHGIDLLYQDKGAEALAVFENCRPSIPQEINIEPLIIQARIGAAFDKKDYEGFLNASKENLALDSTAAMAWASVGSAYACIYADKNDERAKNESLRYVAKAKAIDDTTKDIKAYYNMIEYRLHSRRIIKREDFQKEFPNGWTNN